MWCAVLADIVDVLACPHCGADLYLVDSVLGCDRGHTFDIARQGYVSLLPGSAGKITGDSAEMIAARTDFLERGRFAPIVEEVVAAVGMRDTVLEIGAGTGHYLAAVLQNSGGRGIGVDVSKAAARRVAKAHPKVGSIVADVWQGLPVREGAVDAALCVFAPRNASELRRVLAPAGVLVVVTPTERHQRELISTLGLIGVEVGKAQRLGESLAAHFESIDRTLVEFAIELDHHEVGRLVGMGPSSRHVGETAVADAIARLPEPITVTASVVVGTYARRASAAS